MCDRCVAEALAVALHERRVENVTRLAYNVGADDATEVTGGIFVDARTGALGDECRSVVSVRMPYDRLPEFVS